MGILYFSVQLFTPELFINIHTHQANQEGSLCIQNLHERFGSQSLPTYCSMGLHPWHIEANSFSQLLEELKLYSRKENVLAIGECGLDRLCSTDFKLQENVFRQQIAWANEIAKPLIIHCVRAHREAITILKEMNNIMPVVFHGFNNNETIAHLLLNEGYYLSFGKSLFNPSLQALFCSIPNAYIFLENDDSEIPIENIYRQASKLKNISADTLSLQLQKNTTKVFNIKF